MVQLGEMEGGDIRCQKSKEQEGLLPKRIIKKTKRGSMKAQENKGGLINGKGHARSQGGPLVKRKGYRTEKGKWVNTTMKGKEKKGGRSDLPQGRWNPTHKYWFQHTRRNQKDELDCDSR